MKTLRLFAVVALAVVTWNCGAEVVGGMMKDAGAFLSDSGVAHAQTSCTWTVKRISLVGASTFLTEVDVPQGWEPFAVHDNSNSVLIRKCN